MPLPCRRSQVSRLAGATYVDYDHESDAFGIWSWEGIPGAAAERSGTLQALKRDGDSGAELPLSKADILGWGHADSSATAALSDGVLLAKWSQHTTNLKVRHRKSIACVVLHQHDDLPHEHRAIRCMQQHGSAVDHVRPLLRESTSSAWYASTGLNIAQVCRWLTSWATRKRLRARRSR